jgi:hypothetical protein
MEKFNLKNLNEVEVKEQYRVEISNRFAALENLDIEEDVNKDSETTTEYNEINGDNVNNIRHEASRHLRNKGREYLKDKIDELATNTKNKRIKYLYIGINLGY